MQITNPPMMTKVVDQGGSLTKGWSQLINTIILVLRGTWTKGTAPSTCRQALTSAVSSTPYVWDALYTFGAIDLSTVTITIPTSIAGGTVNILRDNGSATTAVFTGNTISLSGTSTTSAVVAIHAIQES